MVSPAAHRLILLLEQSRPFLNRYACVPTGQPNLDSPLLRHSFQVILDSGQLTVKIDHYSGRGRFKQGDIWGGDGGQGVLMSKGGVAPTRRAADLEARLFNRSAPRFSVSFRIVAVVKVRSPICTTLSRSHSAFLLWFYLLSFF